MDWMHLLTAPPTAPCLQLSALGPTPSLTSNAGLRGRVVGNSGNSGEDARPAEMV